MTTLVALIASAVIQVHPKIAVFPVVDKTGERDLEFSQRISGDGRTYLASKFGGVGYNLIETKKVDETLANEKFSPTDRDQWTTARLIELGHKLNAPQVAFAVVTESTSGDNGAYFNIGGGATGVAKVRIWLIDVDGNKPLLKGVTVEGKSSTNAFGDLSGSRARILRAVQIAFDKGLNDLLGIKKK